MHATAVSTLKTDVDGVLAVDSLTLMHLFSGLHLRGRHEGVDSQHVPA